MIKFTQKLAIIASLVTLSAGYFDVRASEDGLIPMELESPPAQRLTITNTVTPITAEDAKKGFFPQVPHRDLKCMLSGYLCRANNALISARVNKEWHHFILGAKFTPKERSKWAPILLSDRNNLVQQSLYGWWAQRDLEILTNGIFRYQPEDSVAIDVQLSDMYMDTANGELILPAAVSSGLCVTRMTETFVRPVGQNTRKTLVLLLTLSELKRVAQQISADPSFLQNVGIADLSQNAVCALIRHGGDDIAWGFRYTILRFGEMKNLSIWEIYMHEKACGDGSLASGRGAAGAEVPYFVFKPKLVL